MDFITRRITLVVTAEPRSFESHPASEDVVDDLIVLLTEASVVTLVSAEDA